ncbi:hypothetical protein DIC66_18760 [Rhodoferax lacus]|uniref:6-phosphogluconate dehydrogenase n=2 Tax=Rhodoferax lacus TaxID=2184758 RepID=A0A3E1R8N3_9BURK|nr:hypothetical protein DIC66_18760 [Rhodoferax lacus]
MGSFVGFLVMAAVLFTLYTLAALNWSYSAGERAGFMQKLSHKGFVCKTWEGELQLVALPGSMPEKFLFSVRDEAVAQRINATMGKRVALTYQQHIGIPTSCFGETEYFVTEVKELPSQ